jgi:hypothetical protein
MSALSTNFQSEVPRAASALTSAYSKGGENNLDLAVCEGRHPPFPYPIMRYGEEPNGSPWNKLATSFVIPSTHTKKVPLDSMLQQSAK